MSFSPLQEPDRLPGRRIAHIAVAGVIITVAAIVAAWLLMIASGRQPEQQASAAPPPSGLGTVERSLVRSTQRGIDERREQRRELDRFGWADRDAGMASIPIDRAIDLYVTREGGP